LRTVTITILSFVIPLSDLTQEEEAMFNEKIETAERNIAKMKNNATVNFRWSIVTFTTVGYGDVYPVTPFGKALSATIVLIGIMLFAIPTSILTAEFFNISQNENKDND
jgi:voltage-gated potassium channel Kch